MSLKNKRITVTGGNGFLGRNIIQKLWEAGAEVSVFSSKKYNLLSRQSMWNMLENTEPEIIIHAAAKVGGILYNRDHPGELFYENILMGVQMMEAARSYGVEKYVQIGTVCEYPKFAAIPFKESDIWNGYPEETNAPYGIAKKALLEMGQAYRKQYGFNAIHLLPVNMYGPGDNFDLHSSHVIPALIVRLLEAKRNGAPTLEIGGSGEVSREFLFVRDSAEAIVKATELYNGEEPINIGSGSEITIKSLAEMIAKKVGYEGQIVLGNNIPNGQPRRCLDTTRAEKEFGFKASTDLSSGLDETIEWYMGTL
jgi:GDP-L-fucose synthase